MLYFIEFVRYTVTWCTLLPPLTTTCIDPCLSIFLQDKQEKDFIVRHSQTVFELLDEDGNSNISAQEFEGFSFLFNFEGSRSFKSSMCQASR